METISLLFSTPIQKLITQAESQSRLSMKRFLLEPDTSEPNLFGTPPKPPVWPERHPFYWLDRADKGDVNAMLKLGAIYERSGETDKALQWYQKAAQKGNAEGKKKLEALQTKFKTTSGNSK
jgi:TPR repeat protein